jgi:amino acid transporter
MDGLDIFAAIVLLVLLVTIIVGWVVLAMLPGKIARQRNHPQADAINVGAWLGALLGGLFWPLVLIWAFTKPSSNRYADGTVLQEENQRLVSRLSELEKELDILKGGAA